MIDSIIAKYLKHNKRITIPGLGTLVRKDSEGIFVLVEFLRKDDGVLAGLLRTEARLSEQEAAKAISDYVDTIKEKIENQGSVSLKGIGILSLDNDGLYELDSVKVRPAGEPAPERTAYRSIRNIEPDGSPRKPEPQPVKPARPAAARKAATVDENGDPVGDDLFDDTPRDENKSSAVADSVASLFAGAKGLVNSVAGKTGSDRRRRNSTPRRETAGRIYDDSDEEPARDPKRPANEPRRFSDLKPQPEIRGLRYKSSGGYAKRKSPMDKILLVAIVAAILAILVMVYGQIVDKRNMPEPLIELQTETPDSQSLDAATE